jgi:predicted RNase H-like HicB family nuclease
LTLKGEVGVAPEEVMITFAYPAKMTKGRDDRVRVEFVDLPRVSTEGSDERDAIEEAIDALGSDLSIRMSRREDIPAPSPAKRNQPEFTRRSSAGCSTLGMPRKQ